MNEPNINERITNEAIANGPRASSGSVPTPAAPASSAASSSGTAPSATTPGGPGGHPVERDQHSPLAKTERSRVKRQPVRASYDREIAYAILDAGLVAQVAFAVEGKPFVIPMVYGRLGNTLYLHGSVVSRLVKTLAAGIEISLGVTHVDGLVLARSAFHHSVNYRSVVFFGRAVQVTDPNEKLMALEAIVEHVAPGRTAHVRAPNPKEVEITEVLALTLDEGSVKVRTGPPVDDAEDYSLDVWAGVVPLSAAPGAPIADERLAAGTAVPDHVRAYTRSRGGLGVA